MLTITTLTSVSTDHLKEIILIKNGLKHLYAVRIIAKHYNEWCKFIGVFCEVTQSLKLLLLIYCKLI